MSKRLPTSKRQWVRWAVDQLNADANRSADTHLIRLDLPLLRKHGIDIFLKDESSHPTRSLKHRLARSLFLYGLCNGVINQGSAIVESSSGSTAISEAYFASLLGLPFIAIVPESTAQRKIDEITFFGGECRKVPATEISTQSRDLAAEIGGHYIDQFTYAERATDWRGNNNIAESIFHQLAMEEHPDPEYIIAGAGTGGTSATIGRYLRFRQGSKVDTKLVVPDPENSVFLEFFRSGDRSLTKDCGSRIEGIGRPRVEPSFIPEVVDEMLRVSDAQSLAAMLMMEAWMDRRVGASTGTNVYACLLYAQKMIREQRHGSIVSLIGDAGDRYAKTCFAESWRKEQGIDVEPSLRSLAAFASGTQELPYVEAPLTAS